MTIYFAGGELDAFEIPSGTPNMITTAGRYDSSYARAAIGCDVAAPIVARLPAAYSEIWLHCEIYQLGTVSSTLATMFEFRNASNQGCVRLRFANSTALMSLEYWNGSSWVSAGSTTFPANALTAMDVHIKIADVGGLLEVYLAGALLLSYSGDTNLFSGSAVENIWIGGTLSGANYMQLSQVVVADSDSRSMKLATLVPNANGAVDQWTGSYADVDEITINDADYIYTGTADYTELMGLTDLSVAAQTLDVLAFVQTARARRGLTGPQNIQASIYTGSTQYNSGNLTGLGTSFAAIQQTIWETNPNTSGSWTVSDIQGLQMGYKSKA